MRTKEYYKMQIHEMVDSMDSEVLLNRFYTMLKHVKRPEA